MKSEDQTLNRTGQKREGGVSEPAYQKGLGLLRPGKLGRGVSEYGWSLLREDLSLPAAVLNRDRLIHNVRWMRQFAEAYGVKLAPHGKTTMAPSLFALQLDHGAWGITLATAHQTAIAHEHSVRRVLMANQLVGKQNMQMISELLRDPTFDYFCLVDSPELVDQLGVFFRAQGQRLQVLLEIGVEGGRTGARDTKQVEAILHALSSWKDSVLLRGVEVYEGVLQEESEIRALLSRAVDVTRRIADEQESFGPPLILSGAGSAWYDVVAEIFASMLGELAIEVILRPGCYVTSDAGIYAAAQERICRNNPVARRMPDSLQPALQIWSYVQSIPEASRAILAMGKRDVAFDAGLPAPVLHFRPGWSRPQPARDGWKVTKLMDQHAYMMISEQDDLRVGDMIGCEISHPCLTFDKWRYLAVLDSEYEIVDLVETFF